MRAGAVYAGFGNSQDRHGIYCAGPRRGKEFLLLPGEPVSARKALKQTTAEMRIHGESSVSQVLKWSLLGRQLD